MDMYRVNRLYPQYRQSQDRRQQNIPVAVDRRSGRDRRSEDRVQLDAQLTKDIFQVKSKVAQIESMSPNFFTSCVAKNPVTFSAMNNMTNDVVSKETKIDPLEIQRREAEIQKKEGLIFQIGIIGLAMLAAVGISAMSTAGLVVAVGTGLYIGARVLKVLISNHVDGVKKTEEE